MNSPSPYRTPRILTQVTSLLVLNSYFFQSSLKYIPCISFNCYACPLAVFACPIGTLQHLVILNQIPFFTVGVLALFGIVFGRFICGWLCPFGFFQELLYKIPFPKKISLNANRYLPFVILIVLVFLIPWVTKLPWFCRLCPVGTFEAGIPLTIYEEQLRQLIGPIYWIKIGILVALVLLSVASYRPFCRMFCPLGAIYSIFNKTSLVHAALDEECVSCHRCQSYCPLKLDLPKQLNSIECIKCLECAKCAKVRLSFGFKNANGKLFPRRTKRKVSNHQA